MLHEGQYKENAFTPVVNAMELSEYVFTITDNAKKFPEYTATKKKFRDNSDFIIIQMREDSLVNKVRQQAFDIYMNVFTANEINLKRQPYRKEERLKKQLRAIQLCDEHLATIQLCRHKFHLSNKRIKYWGGKTIDLRGIIERWHDSDRDRFKDI
jgi:hypothetical protein